MKGKSTSTMLVAMIALPPMKADTSQQRTREDFSRTGRDVRGRERARIKVSRVQLRGFRDACVSEEGRMCVLACAENGVTKGIVSFCCAQNWQGPRAP